MKLSGILFLFIFCLSTGSINAQIKVGQKIKNQTNNRADKNVDQGINKGLNSVEDGVKGMFKKKDASQVNTDSVSQNGTQQNSTNEKTPSDITPALTSYSRYDFVPGDKILLYEDFSQDAVGDFPALWTTDVAGEINTLNIAPGNWFNLNSTEGTYWLMQDIDFPNNFIMEFDIVPKSQGARIAADVVIFGENNHSEMDKDGDPGTCGLHVLIDKESWSTEGYKKGVSQTLSGSSVNYPVEPDKINHVIIWVQNRRVRIYHKGGKVIDVPTNIYEGSKFTRLCFKLYRGASCGSYISNIKFTTAAPDTRNKLLEEGKLITYGIYFDVNKDVVKPESYGALNDIAKILNEVPDIKVKILGHTDSDGQEDANLDLSKRRAASVKAELAKSFGVNPERIDTDGMGEGQPVAANDTPSNKALNRRVEFIKM